MAVMLRTIRLLTAEIRVALTGRWLNQAALALELGASQRTINSRLQTLVRTGKVKRRGYGHHETYYRMRRT